MTDRRTFLKQTAVALGATASLADAHSILHRDSAHDSSHAETGTKSYKVTVPDTLDLAERCRWAVRALGNLSDPEMYGQMWFAGNFGSSTPYLSHNASDGSCTPKFAECFPQVRYASGSEEFREIEQLQMDNLVANISPEDGIYYSVYKKDRPWHSAYGSTSNLVPEDFAWVGGIGRMMRAMMTWHDRDKDPRWEERTRAMARGLGKIAIFKDDYAYYPDGGHGLQFSYPKSGWKKTTEPLSDAESREGSVVDSVGHTAYGLARWYRMSGDKEALELARKITNFMMLPKMWGALTEEISVKGAEQGHFSNNHLHGRMVGLRGMLEYGWAADDARALEFVRRAYEHLRIFMIPRIGWLGANGIGITWISMEGCCLGDLAALGVRLSDIGLGDYWEDVDALARNILAERQFLDLKQLQKVSAASPAAYGGKLPKQTLTEGALERMLGIVSSGALPNRIEFTGLSGCCNANGTQAFYYCWEGAMRCQGQTATVNLLLNRASPLADVDSYLPYEGKVVVRNKRARRVFLRIPSWIDRKNLRLTVDRHERPLEWVGSYLFVNDLRPKDVVTMTFAVPESKASYTGHHNVWFKEQVYTFEFRGSTCVSVSPRTASPTEIPIFEREYMRQDQAPMREVARVVHNGPPLGW